MTNTGVFATPEELADLGRLEAQVEQAAVALRSDKAVMEDTVKAEKLGLAATDILQRQLAESQAQAAAMRGALSLAKVPLSSRATGFEEWIADAESAVNAIDAVLSSTAGRDLLERVQHLEAESGALREALKKVNRLERVAEAAKDLEAHAVLCATPTPPAVWIGPGSDVGTAVITTVSMTQYRVGEVGLRRLREALAALKEGEHGG